MAQWFYANGEREHGPIDESEFPALVRSGVVTRETLVWTDSMPEWEPAHRHVEGLTHTRPAVPAGGYVDAGDGAGYRRKVDMKEALVLFFSNYVNFRDRSNRGEFWWFMLASLLISIVSSVIDVALFGDLGAEVGVLSNIWSLAILIPSFALNARRLHDIDRTGWWQLLIFVPIIGWIVLLVWFCQKPDPHPNRFG